MARKSNDEALFSNCTINLTLVSDYFDDVYKEMC